MKLSGSNNSHKKKFHLSNLKLEKLLRHFILKREDLNDLQSRIDTAFAKGLNGEYDEYLYHPLKMVPTFLSLLLDGTETGRFIAIDIGGTNLRFIEIHVDNEELIPISICHKIPQEIMRGTCEKFFDYIAHKIEMGLKEIKLIDVEIDYLGFTFSFPYNQLDLNSGVLIRWTKGFSIKDVVGEDVVLLLKKACSRRNLKIKEFILINDTTGTLLCGSFEDKKTRIGVINGTGTNACYVEKASKVTKWISPLEQDNVLINTEWGSFGENGELSDFLTFADQQVDQDSINPESQIFEKMISGMYLGEIVRQILLKAFEFGLIFKDTFPKFLQENYSFDTSLISESYNEEKFKQKIKEKYFHDLSISEYEIIAKICDVISRRSAQLCAVGLTVALQRVETLETVIAADGSIFKMHPFYIKYVKDCIESLAPEKKFNIITVNDGSGKGAALAACVATLHDNHNLFQES